MMLVIIVLELKHMKPHSSKFYIFSIIGPGIVVMLADSDAGSLITASQSGAAWGYKLLLLQFLLIPILYITQELAVRLGIFTGKGHGELIKDHFGKKWAWFSVTTLLVTCFGAIVTEFVGVVGVGNLFGVSPTISVSLAAAFLIIIVWTSSYLTVERFAIILGLFELVFFYVAFKAHPSMSTISSTVLDIPIHNKDYLFLVAGNIGAVIMPFMIFYQQSAIVDKKLRAHDLSFARIDTLIGAILTQLIMATVLVAVAATIGKVNPNVSLNTVEQISHAITPFLGEDIGKIIFAIGILGASMVAAVVVSLTASWGVGEVMGFKRSLQDHLKEAPIFYALFTLFLIIGAIVVASGKINLVKLSISVEVMNAILLPIVLIFLFLLAKNALPEKYRLKGTYAYITGTILFLTSAFGVYAGISGAISG